MGESRTHFGRAFDIAKIDRRERIPDRHKVDMSIVEPGQQQTSLPIDHARVWTDQPLDAGSLPDGKYPVSRHGHGFCRGVSADHCPNLRIDHDEISGANLSRGLYRKQDGEEEKVNQTAEKLIRAISRNFVVPSAKIERRPRN